MTQHSIAVVVGSLRRESINRRLANALIKLAPAGFEFKHVSIGELPLYNQDEEKNPPEAVRRLKAEVSDADGLIFVTPEYNRSIPGVLKNALDHASRPYGQSAWAGKPAGIIGCSSGGPGTAMAQQHLRNVLAYLDMPTMAQPEGYVQIKDDTYDKAGNLNADTAAFLKKWMDRYTAWVTQFQHEAETA